MPDSDFLDYDASVGGAPSSSGCAALPMLGVCCENDYCYTAPTLCLPPEITSPSSASSIGGTSFSYTITSRNAVTSISVSSLPSWLSFDGESTVSGTSPGSDGNYSFNIQATSDCGSTFKTVGISVAVPPTIVSFTASPTDVTDGKESLLSWVVTGIISSVSIDNGIGLVGASSSTYVSPVANTTYTLTALGIGGTSTAQVTVGVNQWTIGPQIVGSPLRLNPTVGIFYTQVLPIVTYPGLTGSQRVFVLFTETAESNWFVDDFFQLNGSNVLNLTGGIYQMAFDGVNVTNSTSGFSAIADAALAAALTSIPGSLYDLTSFWHNSSDNTVTGLNNPAGHSFLANFKIVYYKPA